MTDDPLIRVRSLPLQSPNIGREVALAAVAAARSDIGLGEELANNQGPYVWSLTGRRTSGAWCAAAVYTWYLRGAEAVGVALGVERTHGARRLARRIAAHGIWVEARHRPQPGDVALWSRGLSWQGHVGIVSEVGTPRRVAADWPFTTIEGNRGKFPAIVREFEHQTDERKLLGFARYY